MTCCGGGHARSAFGAVHVGDPVIGCGTVIDLDDGGLQATAICCACVDGPGTGCESGFCDLPYVGPAEPPAAPTARVKKVNAPVSSSLTHQALLVSLQLLFGVLGTVLLQLLIDELLRLEPQLLHGCQSFGRSTALGLACSCWRW